VNPPSGYSGFSIQYLRPLLRQANSDQVKEIRIELNQMKLIVEELSLKNRGLKKACLVWKDPWTTVALLASRESGIWWSILT